VGVFLSEVMVAVGMQPSKGAVRRMIKNGGVRMNNVKVEDDEVKVREEDLVEGKLLLLTAGKKNKVMVRIEI
jgi:tyrosyl-tRNA synthetase